MIETYVCTSCQNSIEWDDSTCEEYIECSHCGASLKVPNAPMFTKGTVVGDYVVERRLGIGGMGEVYLAEQQSMKRKVALKVLQPDLIEDESYLERFYREVRILAQIEHPNIVKAIETGYENNICYFSMSYIEGKDLKEKLDTEGRMSEVDALYVVLNVAEALKFVWERHKIIHRDIKPANIILTPENEVKLMDLGISKSVADDRPADLTIPGMMVGSPYYISPEQARAEKDIDWRADMYSLGASFYHMVTGELPYDSENTMAIIAAHLSEPVPDPRLKNPELSDKSAMIIGRMMQKERNARFSSWDEAIAAVEDAIADLTAQGASTTIMTAVTPSSHFQNAFTSVGGNEKLGLPQTPPVASEDIVSKVRNFFAQSKLLGNLYFRFVVLVLFLFLAFLAFFKVVKQSMYEAKVKKARAGIEKYMSYKTKMTGKNKRERQVLLALLQNIRKVGVPKATAWANTEMALLQKKAITERALREKENINAALIDLKQHSYELERKGEIRKAMNLWENYRKNGAYSNQLASEINTALDYLGRLQKKRKKINVIE